MGEATPGIMPRTYKRIVLKKSNDHTRKKLTMNNDISDES